MSQNPYSQVPPEQPQPPVPPPAQPQPPYGQAPYGQQMAPGYYVPPARSTWPTVIGIISLIWASLGLICTPISVVINAANPQRQQFRQYFPPWWGTYEVIAAILGMAFAVLLLVAGISLLKRRPAARSLHLAYAIAYLAMLVIAAIVMVPMLGGIMSDAPLPMRAAMIAGALGGTCVGMIYPVFLLIWFLRARIAEEVRTWTA